MSTIGICSIHTGINRFTLPTDEEREVNFVKQEDGLGFAEVTEEEAAHLLGIGEPNYFKPKSAEKTLEEIINDDPEAKAAAEALKAGKKTVAELSALIKVAATVEEIDALVGNDPRAGVVKAAEDRKAELAA